MEPVNQPFTNLTFGTSAFASDHPKKPPEKPPSLFFTPHSLLNRAETLISRSRKLQQTIINNIPADAATFENTVLPLAQIQNEIKAEAHVLEFCQHVVPSSELRFASQKAKKLFSEFELALATNRDLFHIYENVLSQAGDLDHESQKLIRSEFDNFVQHGQKLPDLDRKTLKTLQQRLSQLSIDFRANLNKERSGFWFSREELEGVPEDILSSWDQGSGSHHEQLQFTFNDVNTAAILTHAKHSKTREKVYVGYANTCNENVPILKEAITLRHEVALMLGYPNHATLRLREKMIKSPETINSFLENLQSTLSDAGRKEIQELSALKKADLASRGLDFDGQYYLWDHSYYCRIMQERKFSINMEKVSEYFPLLSTIKRMLEIFQEIFGLTISRNTSTHSHENHLIWHEDVLLYNVWDKNSDEFLGYLYMDLYPRDGKIGHASNWNLRPGKRRCPATALVCNFPKPTNERPSLLRHNEVWLLFHELGHGIHDLVSKTKYARFHGTMTAQDFCEIPSQMLENWCWNPQVLKRISQHYSTISHTSPRSPEMLGSAEIPDEMLKRLLQGRFANKATFYLHSIHVSTFDMTIHQPRSLHALKAMNTSILWNSLKKEVLDMQGPEIRGEGYDWGHYEVTFPHFMGDYDAGYYGYLISQIYALDMFHSVFKKNLMNTKEGYRYRKLVLEKGGSGDEMAMLTEFLGRPPRTDAFFHELGLDGKIAFQKTVMEI